MRRCLFDGAQSLQWLHHNQETAMQPITLAPEAQPEALDVIGVKITVLASREQTASHEVTYQEGAEGAGPPPHSHAWTESFYVLRGSVHVMVAGQQLTGTPGAFIHVPANTVHAFHFGPGGGAMLEIAGQGGAATAMFRQLDAEVPPGPPDIPKVVSILQGHGVAVALPAGEPAATVA
jgi:quercetin dioxygenase-like cupin family protein